MKPENLPEKIDEKIVENLIYEIRDMQVMLDSDVAYFFGVGIKNLNLAMKRNKQRFPEDFCFQINSKEFKNLRLQIETFRESTKGRKYAPYMYTEHGKKIFDEKELLQNQVSAKNAHTQFQRRELINEKLSNS